MRVCVCAPCIYIFYIWHTHIHALIHALMNNSDIQTCLRLVIWCVHVNSGSIPGPTIAAIAIRDVIPGSHFHSTVVFLGSPLGIRIENQSSKPSKDIQGSRGLRMFSSTNLRRVIMIVSTMPSTVKSKNCRPLRMSSSKPLILRGRRKIWRNKDHVSTQSWG